MSKSAQTYDGSGEKPTDPTTRQTSHALALELSDPPLCEFGVWSSVVDLAADATEHAIEETN